MSRDIQPRLVQHSPVAVLTSKLCERLGPDVCSRHGTREGLCIGADRPCKLHSETDVKRARQDREKRYDGEGRKLTADVMPTGKAKR